jgi:hypothetical protein
MKHFLIFTAVALLWAAYGLSGGAQAGHWLMKGRAAAVQSQAYPWHGDYYDVAWGSPVALVVPPTAESQAHLGWGVGATRVTPIAHQFGRGYPGPSTGGGPFYPTPPQPSSTDQFGDYYIRGPW